MITTLALTLALLALSVFSFLETARHARALRIELARVETHRAHWERQARNTLGALSLEKDAHRANIDKGAQRESALLAQRNALSVQVSNMAHELNNANERERNARATLAHLETSTAFTLGELDEMKRTRALFAVIDELAK